MPHPSRTLLATILGLALASAPFAGAQEASFGEVVDVALVEVEVWVSDSAGNPVAGLSAADFEVFEDGAPVVISHFREVQGATEREQVIPLLEPQATPQQIPRRVPVRAPGHLVVYFDQNHLRPGTRKRMIQDLRLVLVAEEVAPERVLLLSQADRLRTVAPFGSSLRKLEEALDELESTGAQGFQNRLEKRQELTQLQELWQENPDCNRFLRTALALVERYAAEQGAEVQKTLSNLETATIFLAGLPGVKTLLYVSDALEISPGVDLFAYVDAICPTQGRNTSIGVLSSRLRDEFTRLSRQANAGRVTFYTVQSQGLEVDFLSGADQTMIEFQGGGTVGFESTLRNNQREGHFVLADETGGRTVVNRNRFLPELRGIASSMNNYYSLAYAAPHGGDGEFHRIEVKVRDGKLNLRHRLDYRDKDADDRLADRLESTSFLGYISNPLDARVGAGEARPWNRKLVSLPVHVQVPVARLTFLPHGGTPTAQVTIRIAARNTETNKVVYHHKVQRAPRPAAKVEALDFSAVFKLEKGIYVLAAGLRDDASRESSFIRTFIDLGEAENDSDKKTRRRDRR